MVVEGIGGDVEVVSRMALQMVLFDCMDMLGLKLKND